MIYNTFIQIPFYQYIKSYKSVNVGDVVYHWQALCWVYSIVELSDAWDIDLYTITIGEIYLMAFIP